MIQSNFSFLGNGPGNLELVAVTGDRIVEFFRPDGQPGPKPDCTPLRARLAELERTRERKDSRSLDDSKQLQFPGYGQGNGELVALTDKRVAYAWRPDAEAPNGQLGSWILAADVPTVNAPTP